MQSSINASAESSPVADTKVDPHCGAAVELDHVSQVFLQDENAIPALDRVNLSIPPGEFVSLVGPSGCGKTTILTLLAGLSSPSRGEVRLGGQVVRGPSPRTSYMMARDALLPWQTVLQNAEFGLRVRGVDRTERRRRAREWLERVGLADFENARVRELSQGMRQRAALARTLSMSPDCILMDEPFAALDAQTRLVIQEAFIRLWEQLRATVVFVTHDLTEAILLSDRVILMGTRPGRILLSRPVLLERPRVLTEIQKSREYTELYDELWTGLRPSIAETGSSA